MSLFRSRKKSFSEGENGRRPSLDEAPPLPTGLGKYSFKRKKDKQEAKKEIDIATALPSKDDFRTSLLMPNLSARFSMLREQDDPNTKVGKASDDSVLFPKRVSRLNLFMNADLGDIAEVSSLSGSIRPPFAMERSSTYSSNDGYGTDDDRSVMHRARPGQGNKFFGGRQKIYMLSTKDGEGGQSRSRGRAVYDDDINISAFKPSTENKRSSEDNDHDFDTDYNSKRETSSSTGSGPIDGRTSTAATSVASASPATLSNGFTNKLSSFSTNNTDRSAKGKRLYGQGIDQHILDQQSSALNRLNSVQRNFGPGMVHYGSGPTIRSNSTATPGATKAAQSTGWAPVQVSQGTTNSLTGFDFGMTQDAPKDVTPRSFGISAMTMSPPMSPADPTLAAALDANDIGKATATGAFNKPAGPYNDEQFAQRQLQLQQGRETPPGRAFSRASSSNTNNNAAVSRERNGSLASQRSAFSFQSSQARTQPSIRDQTSVSQLRNCDTPEKVDQNIKSAFLADDSASEYESDSESPTTSAPQTVAQAALSGSLDRHRKYEHDDQHPAFNSQMVSQEDLTLDVSSEVPIESHSSSVAPSIHSSVLDTATNSSNKGGLSDLVRGHLRNISNQSSVYPDSPRQSKHYEMPDFPTELAQQAALLPATSPIESPAENPLAARARLLRENANQLKNASAKLSEEQALETATLRRDEDSSSPEVPWQEQLKMHQRQGSTETQREREDFANELADRRKQVQNKLRDLNSRSNDPSPSRNGPLGLLKKSSLGSLAHRSESSSKAAKALETQNSSFPSDSKFRSRSNSRSAENLSKFSGQSSSFRDRIMPSESRQNFLQNSLNSPGRGMERSPPPAKSMSPIIGGYGFPYKAEEPRGAYHPAGRARKYSPPSTARSVEPGQAPYVRSASAQSQNNAQPARGGSSNGSYVPSADASSPEPRPGDRMSPPHRHATSPPDMPWINGAANRNGSAPNLPLQTSRKMSVNKSDISLPSFVSGTANIATPPVPRLDTEVNGPNAPPLPPINPRRRGQNFFSPFGGRSGHEDSTVSTPTSAVTSPLERNTFLTEEPEELPSPPAEPEGRSRFRARLRKSSSAGDNLSHRSRHQALKDLDKMPMTSNVTSMNAGMF